MGLRPIQMDENPVSRIFVRAATVKERWRDVGVRACACFSTECPWACGPPKWMKMGPGRDRMTRERNGRGRNRSGDVEAVTEFGPGRVYEPILATFPFRRGRAISA